MQCSMAPILGLQKIDTYSFSALIQNMANNQNSTDLEDRVSTGRVSMPIPILCKSFGNLTLQCGSSYLGQEKMLPNKIGWCERTVRVIKTERDLELLAVYEELKKKDRLIAELANRLDVWNDTECPICHTGLRGDGPGVLDEHQEKYYRDLSSSDDESKPAAHTEDTEEDPTKKTYPSNGDGLQFPMEDI